MRALLVHNPTAGGGRAGKLLPAVAGRLRAGGVQVDEHATRSLEDARVAACEAAGTVDAVVAVGGDGTVGACAGGLADAGPGARAALGVVPAGGGNDAARSLGLPFGDPLAAAALLPGLHRRPADLARVGERSYLVVAGAGFDSEVNRVANQRLAWAPARARYAGALLVELVVGRPAGFRLTLDGQEHQLRAWFVAVANSQSYGGGMRIAPDARLDDGLLDVVVIGDIGRAEFLAAFPKVFSGRHVDHRAVTIHRARRVELAADRALAVYADGEPAGSLPAGFEVHPAAINVMAADGAPAFAAG
ncbi:MAG TPA: diacylglycerol kinase family protein [Actinomycetes bacterium]|nr:diacylglycerol kinase family protein [Actinomycetes bacterium]